MQRIVIEAGRFSRSLGLSVVVAVVLCAAPAGAVGIEVQVFFEDVPPTPVYALQILLEYDEATLVPLGPSGLPAEPGVPAGEVLVTVLSPAGDGGLFLGSVFEPGVIQVGGISAAGFLGAGDLFGVRFDFEDPSDGSPEVAIGAVDFLDGLGAPISEGEQPQLRLRVIPEPKTVILLGLALASLAIHRRRRA
jgi:hypothetical protein